MRSATGPSTSTSTAAWTTTKEDAMHSRTIDTPPAELRKLVPKLTREIEELERLRAEAAAALAALDEAHRVVKNSCDLPIWAPGPPCGRDWRAVARA
jgi:hypothetical protein